MVFQYGFYYAQHLILFTIVLVFSTTVPMISIAGFMFFGMRHIVDSYNLLTVNRKEIDSSCKVFQKILLYFQFAILMLQLCMISYLATNEYLSCACFVGVVFSISILVVFFTNKSLFDIAKQDQSIFNDTHEPISLEQEIGCPSEDGGMVGPNSQLYVPIMKWRSEYAHPLMINSADRQDVASTNAERIGNSEAAPGKGRRLS